MQRHVCTGDQLAGLDQDGDVTMEREETDAYNFDDYF